jgi:hypothetical protein
VLILACNFLILAALVLYLYVQQPNEKPSRVSIRQYTLEVQREDNKRGRLKDSSEQYSFQGLSSLLSVILVCALRDTI